MSLEEPQTISREVDEELARRLRERYIRDHIRDFDSFTVVCIREEKEIG